MDAFWTDTHTVDFEEVKSKSGIGRDVQLVRGDFHHHLRCERYPARFLFVYIDCDSYRATTYPDGKAVR